LRARRGGRLIYLPQCRYHRALYELARGIDPHLETTTLHVSTISDSWIRFFAPTVSPAAHCRSSNRVAQALNQLRELVFTDNGITLADPYMAGASPHGHFAARGKRDEEGNQSQAFEIDQSGASRADMSERDHHLGPRADLRKRAEELTLAERGAARRVCSGRTKWCVDATKSFASSQPVQTGHWKAGFPG
jgi:hypothetical protein